MTNDKLAAREWWIVETRSSYFIYEDEATATKECISQKSAYGYAEAYCVVLRSDYEDEKELHSISKLVAGNYEKQAKDLLQERDEARSNDAKCEAARIYVSELLEAERVKSDKFVEALKDICAYYEDGKKNGGHMYVVAHDALTKQGLK